MKFAAYFFVFIAPFVVLAALFGLAWYASGAAIPRHDLGVFVFFGGLVILSTGFLALVFAWPVRKNGD